MTDVAHHLLCNGATAQVPDGAKSLRLDYRGKNLNVRIALPVFVDQLLHVPARFADSCPLFATLAIRYLGSNRTLAVILHSGCKAAAMRLQRVLRDFGMNRRKPCQQDFFAGESF